MVRIQNLSGGRDAGSFLGCLGPGQFQAHVQVVAQNRGLSGAVGLLFQVHDLFQQLLLHLFGQAGVRDLAAVGGDLVVAVLPQLLLDHPYLLPQEGVLLVLGHVLLDLALDVLLHLQDLHLPVEQPVHAVEPVHRALVLQDGLLVQHPHGDVLGDEVRDIAGVLAGHDVHQHLGGRVFGGQLRVAVEELIGPADHRLGPQGVGLSLDVDLLLLHGDDLALQIRLGLGHGPQDGPALALHHDPDGLTGQAQDLAHLGDGARGEKILFLRLLHPDVLLGHQEDGAVGGHGLLHRLHRGLPAHVKVDHHLGVDHQAPQGQDGHRDGVRVVKRCFVLCFFRHRDSLPFRQQTLRGPARFVPKQKGRKLWQEGGEVSPSALLCRFGCWVWVSRRCPGGPGHHSGPARPQRPACGGAAVPGPG